MIPARGRACRPVWGIVGLAAQAAFTGGWALAETWQGPSYSWITNSISDMQAANAPHAWFPILALALGGIGSFLFVAVALRPQLRSAAPRGDALAWLLAVAVLAIGNSFPLIPCQVGPGCSANQQLLSAGGLTDAIVATLAFLIIALSPGPLWHRLQRLPKWRSFRPAAVAASIVCPAAFLVLCAASITGVDEGLAERLLAAACSLWLAALSAWWLAAARRPQETEPGDRSASG